MLEQPPSKACSCCRRSQELADFTKDKTGPLGLSRVCRACMAERRRAYRASEKVKAATAAYNKKYAGLNADRLRSYASARWRATKGQTKDARAAQSKAKRERNREVIAAQRAKNLIDNPAHRARNNARAAQWYLDNKTTVIERGCLYYIANTAKVKANAREREQRLRVELRPKKLAHTMLRIARKKMASPAWADLRAIEAIYCEAQKLNDLTGIPHEVDHMVPLQGRTVCGLHVAANLQVIPRYENQSKGNRYWPDQWE